MKTKKVEKNTAAKKPDAQKAAAAVASEIKEDIPVTENPVNEVRAEEPADEVKAEEPKAEVKPAAAKKTAAKKETAAAKASNPAASGKAAKQSSQKTEKQSSQKTEKQASKRTVKQPSERIVKQSSERIVLQISGSEMTMENIVDRVKEAYVTEGHSSSSIKDVAVYIKPEENMIYYVIDGYASGISLH